MKVNAKLRARLRAKIEVLATGCWRWLGAINSKGYGTVYYNGQQVCAHRVTYMEWTGNAFLPKHDGHHNCGITWCVAPHHIQQKPHWRHPHYNYRKGYRRLEAL